MIDLESIGFLIIVLAWILRAVLGPLMKNKQGPKPAAPTDAFGENKPRTAPSRPVPSRRPAQSPQPARSSRPMGRGAERPAEAPPPPPPAPTPAQPPATRQQRMQDLLREIGLDFEEVRPEPAPSPPPVPEPRPAASTVTAAEASGRSVLAGRTAFAGRHDLRDSALNIEDGLSAMEQEAAAPLLGDAARPEALKVTGEAPAIVAHQAPSVVARGVLADLRGGGAALARAMVLKEVLGPPVSLRDSGERERDLPGGG